MTFIWKQLDIIQREDPTPQNYVEEAYICEEFHEFLYRGEISETQNQNSLVNKPKIQKEV